jgi:predicted acyl esterase
VDVFPDGYANLIQDGIIRTSYRESETKPSKIEPDQIKIVKNVVIFF